MVEDEY
jgi:hypothetical protein